ncbi:MAG: molybdenum cofactor biosynthesis protein MoaE [Nitrospirae bacterium]|jgi:molybdopterin synthase catalytic subunit|nr:molybdenum cofactor biosynthesis protein MoaE [Nitrospirota bacterium]
MIEKWIAEIKKGSDFKDLGMFLIHNGVVRATSKDGKIVKGMNLSYDREILDSLMDNFRKREGIVAIKVWINEGTLKVGDDIMYVLVAGKLRTYVLPALQELVSKIKEEVVFETEFF